MKPEIHRSSRSSKSEILVDIRLDLQGVRSRNGKNRTLSSWCDSSLFADRLRGPEEALGRAVGLVVDYEDPAGRGVVTHGALATFCSHPLRGPACRCGRPSYAQRARASARLTVSKRQ